MNETKSEYRERLNFFSGLMLDAAISVHKEIFRSYGTLNVIVDFGYRYFVPLGLLGAHNLDNTV